MRCRPGSSATLGPAGWPSTCTTTPVPSPPSVIWVAVSVATEIVDEGNAARPARSTSTVRLAQRPDGRPHPPVQFAVQPGGRVEVPDDAAMVRDGVRRVRPGIRPRVDFRDGPAVGPEQSAAGESGRAAGARKLLAERPPGRRGKPRLEPPRRRRYPLGHPVDHDQLGRRRWCRRLGVHYGVGDVTCNPDGKECEVQE